MREKTSINMLCIGEPLKEYVAVRDPETGALSQEEFTGFAGDVAPNMASYAKMAAKEFGVPCTIDVLTALGQGPKDEGFSDRAIEDLKARGLGTHLIRRFEGKTMGTVINLINPDGTPADEKVRLSRKDSAFRDLLNDAKDEDLKQMVEDYSHIVVSGIPLGCVRERQKLVKLLEYAKEKVPPARIIVSTNLRPSNWRMPDNENPEEIDAKNPAWKEKAQHWLDKIIPLADTLFANYTDEKDLRGSTWPLAAAEHLHHLNPQAEIVLTNDAKPIQLLYRDGKKYISTHVDIHRPEEVVDTVGAGDALAATYVMAREAGYTPKQATQLGTYAASKVVGIKGALPKAADNNLSFTLPGIRIPERDGYSLS